MKGVWGLEKAEDVGLERESEREAEERLRLSGIVRLVWEEDGVRLDVMLELLRSRDAESVRGVLFRAELAVLVYG